MSSSEFHERFESNPLCEFRLGTVATSDHETPLTKMRAVQGIMLGREGVETATRLRKKLTDLRKNGDQWWFAPRR